jgi:hypothetical protein
MGMCGENVQRVELETERTILAKLSDFSVL